MPYPTRSTHYTIVTSICSVGYVSYCLIVSKRTVIGTNPTGISKVMDWHRACIRCRMDERLRILERKALNGDRDALAALVAALRRVQPPKPKAVRFTFREMGVNLRQVRIGPGMLLHWNVIRGIGGVYCGHPHKNKESAKRCAIKYCKSRVIKQ